MTIPHISFADLGLILPDMNVWILDFIANFSPAYWMWPAPTAIRAMNGSIVIAFKFSIQFIPPEASLSHLGSSLSHVFELFV